MPASSPRAELPPVTRVQPLALSVVVAVVDGGARLGGVLDALREARLGVPFEVLALVGGEAAPALRAARMAHPLVRLYRRPEAADLGTLYEAGARLASGRHLLLLDGSARLDGPGVAELVRFAETGQWIAAVAPRRLDAEGAEQPATSAFPTPTGLVAAALGLGTPAAAPAPRIQNALTRVVTTPKEVDAAAGGCVLVRRQAVLDAGGFAAGYAPGGEVLDWCMRARLKGWAVFYHPGVEARATGFAPAPAPAERRATAVRFVRRYYGVAAGLVAAAAGLVAAAATAPAAWRERPPVALMPVAAPEAARSVPSLAGTGQLATT